MSIQPPRYQPFTYSVSASLWHMQFGAHTRPASASPTPASLVPASLTAGTGSVYFAGQRLDALKARLKKWFRIAPVTPPELSTGKDIPSMISFDFANADAKAVGPEHGLDLQKDFDQYADKIRAIVTNLYATKDEPGGWKKWLNLGYDEALAESINRYAEQAKGKYDDLVVLGIGGSSLGGLALLKALKHPYWNNLPDSQRNGLPRYHFVDNVDSDQVAGLLDVLNPRRTLFCVISKSGTTAETMGAFMIAKSWLENAMDKAKVREHVVAITDNNTGVLRSIADREGYETFEVPDDVGGRFSVFSAVGLLPAALCGVDIAEMQRGIRDIDQKLQNPDIHRNPAAQNALIHYLMDNEKGKRVSVFMPYSARLASVSDWYAQLWAESLGKKTDVNGNVVNAGQTPVRSVGVTDQHSQVQLFNEGPHDKLLTFVNVGEPDRTMTIPGQFEAEEKLAYLRNQPMHRLMDAEFRGTRDALTQNKRPNVTLTLPRVDAYHFAQLLYLLEVQTAITGGLMNINAFDQPGVELGKKLTKEYMTGKTPAQLA